jgi:3-oxoacyl-[acyl-carrier-protein] synthase III
MEGTDVYVAAVGTALPGPPVDNAALIHRFSAPAATGRWIDTFVGIRTRHFGFDLDTGEVRYFLADIGETAARRALAAAGASPADVHLMVMGTASPDMLMPTTVNMIAERLGINGIPTYQIQSGCAGAVQALDVAYQMLRAGPYRTALVLGGDTCVKHFPITADASLLPPAVAVNGMLFGDGAGAAVLTKEPTAGACVIRRIVIRTEGLGRPPGQIIEWFGASARGTGRPSVSEDYKTIEELVPKMAVEMLNELLDDLDWPETEVDYLLPPQLSGRMTERIVESLPMSVAQEISCVAETGNTGNALPFFQLERALPRLVVGDRVLGIAIESSKWIKAGFALETI